MGTTHPKCRRKGKIVIRVGNIIPPAISSLGDGRFVRCSRKLGSVVALTASVAALLLIVHQHDPFGFGQTLQRALPEMFASTTETGAHPRPAAVNPDEESRYRALSEFVARRYRVSQDVAYDLVGLAHNVGRQHALDPLLIIAVIAIESRFNPIAESVAGAKGLMQIIPRYHTDKLEEYGGEKAVFDPVANVKVGAQILKEYLRLTGNLGIALQMYAGALGDTDDQYTSKVLNEKNRLQQALLQSVARSAPAAPIRTVSARPQLLSPSPLE
ncbi:MAG: transglycosylase SLT domain-containing protein [Betaproteobacteria bacterium]|nr:transglycosylase SLT domain-containing protein [Betaproteobacteria bacterium]